MPIAITKLQNLSVPASACLVRVCLYNQKKHINIVFLVTPSPLLLSWKENMNMQKQQLAVWNAGQFPYTELGGSGMLKKMCVVVAWPWPANRHPHSCMLTPFPQWDREENKTKKSKKTCESNLRQGNHSSVRAADKTHSIWGIYLNLKHLVTDLVIGK